MLTLAVYILTVTDIFADLLRRCYCVLLNSEATIVLRGKFYSSPSL